MIRKFADSINVKDLDSTFMITAVNEDAKELNNSQSSCQDSVNKFCSKLEIVVHGVVSLTKTNQTLSQQLQKIGNEQTKQDQRTDFNKQLEDINIKLRKEVRKRVIYYSKIKGRSH